jgi:hypothetical protein
MMIAPITVREKRDYACRRIAASDFSENFAHLAESLG